MIRSTKRVRDLLRHFLTATQCAKMHPICRRSRKPSNKGTGKTALSTYLFNKLEGDRIDTVPKVRRWRSVVEDVPEVGITHTAENLNSSHEKAIVIFL